MSDKDYFHEPNHTVHLRVWALGQMVWGAFIAGSVLVGVGLVLLAVWGISLLLPEESKQNPSPYSAIEVISPDRLA